MKLVKKRYWDTREWRVDSALVFCWLLSVTAAPNAQMATVNPQVRARAIADGKVTVVEIAAHFVTAIRLPEAVNSVAVGDPALFQVEHLEREPELVLVKALTERSAETNLLISGVHGRQFSLLLVSRGIGTVPAKVDFLVQYKSAGSFLVETRSRSLPIGWADRSPRESAAYIEWRSGERRSRTAGIHTNCTGDEHLEWTELTVRTDSEPIGTEIAGWPAAAPARGQTPAE